MSTPLRLVRLGRHHGPPDDEQQVAAAAALSALRVDVLLTYDDLSASQLARRLDVDQGRLVDVLDEAEVLGLVRFREGRYALTRLGERLRRSRQRAVPRQRGATLVG